jgi:hypothetical protein
LNDFRLIFLILIFLFTISCKEDDASPNIYTGEASALKNGTEWRSVVMINENNHDTQLSLILSMNTYNKEGFAREGLIIYKVKNSFNKQLIYDTEIDSKFDSIGCHFSTFIDDGDVVGDIYKLDATATNNFIQITNYSSSKAEVEGVFNVSLILSRDDGEGDAPPEKLEFTNGKFRVKVKREWFE